ncbi:hypothetical protein SAMN04488519_107238 [Algoriphagus ornithinivorans]|uniref:Uncharacterized protein n=1 Tax=Algoriphagus ornithinivorans TaxID=226506 RepID=A0A1I5HSG4_9BACT|nr:hypothetical protein [Algoriphagus ornithinivorans]SFO51232.1 hypothetical protein SAMN04488519_107238 [Algoriphagus ornithinivorans]
MKKILLIIFFSLFLGPKVWAQQNQKEIELSLENLFYGNDNEILTKLYWLNQENIIGLRYENDIPKDLVLLNRARLIKDSLSINRLFIRDYNPKAKKFIAINSLIQTDKNEIVILHGYGSSKIKLINDKLELESKSLPNKKPDISDEYFRDYELVQLGDFTIGYKVNPSKWIKDADYWIFNWNNGTVSKYEDSKITDVSKNRFWDMKNDPEPYSTYTHFLYNIIQTKDGFLFNLPLKNRFVLYDSQKNIMQGYQFPELRKKSQAWFVFYDREWNRFFPVLDLGGKYEVYSLDLDKEKFTYLSTTNNQPLGIVGGKVYMRNFSLKENKSGYFFDHHLVDLYPRLE